MRRTAGGPDEPRVSRNFLRPVAPDRASSGRTCPRTSARSDFAPMAAVLGSPAPRFPLILGWPRLRIMLIMALGFALVHTDSPTPFYIWFARCLTVAMFATIAYGIFERWPQSLPSGFAAIMRRREMEAREQAMRVERERSELERQGADTRLRLLQAQVQPHFLFNTLANIRALVNAGSPRAVQVMDSLIAYLRASVPRLQQADGAVGQELDLVRAYLELMHMRMPDRLHYSVECEATAANLRCPPMALLTLVENAVRHGIDPSEEGGRIDENVHMDNGRCIATVADTGVGLRHESTGGSGLANLRERMKLAFGDAQLKLRGTEPHGTQAVLDYPALASSPACASRPPPRSKRAADRY